MAYNCGCFGCKRRNLGCHATCDSYKEYKNEIEKVRQVKIAVMDEKNIFFGRKTAQRLNKAQI